MTKQKRTLKKIINRPSKKPKPRSDGKLFAFTSEDEYLMAKACESAKEFMNKYGQGQRPLKPGFAISRQSDVVKHKDGRWTIFEL